MAVLVVVVCLFGTLVGRLWYLQGVQGGTKLASQVASEGEETFYIPAQRGDIFDRNGVLLAGNRIEQVVTVDPGAELAHPGIVDELSALLGEPAAVVKAASTTPSTAPTSRCRSPWAWATRWSWPSTRTRPCCPGCPSRPNRCGTTPTARATANIVGYLSRITGPEYTASKGEKCGPGIPCYQSNSQIGQAGVEATFERYLRGTPGKEVVAVDSQGHGALPDQRHAPGLGRQPGPVHLSGRPAGRRPDPGRLGGEGQEHARPGEQPAASGPAASMVVEDPRNGQVLALATYPDYNPADFLQPGGISQAAWDRYNNPKNNFPSKTGPFPPRTDGLDLEAGHGHGGAPTTACGAPPELLRCRELHGRHPDLPDNADSGYGNVDLQQAITVSSDAYFYSLGYQFWQLWANDKSHPEYLQQVASQYGLGHYSGIDLPGEGPGIVPSQQVFTKEHQQYPKAYPDPYFYPGQEIEEAIGEGADEVTALQLDNAYAAFGNGGTLYVPQVALAVEAPGTGDKPNGKILKLYFPRVKDHVQMPSASDRAVMLAGFEGVTSDTALGTAAAAFTHFPINQYPVAGKTGTAQVESYCSTPGNCPTGSVPWPAYKQDTSVFASFAPAPDPRFAVDAVFEQSGYGANVAAPAVEQEYTTLFGLNRPAKSTCRGRTTTTSVGAGAATTSTTAAPSTTATTGAPCSATTTSTTAG